MLINEKRLKSRILSRLQSKLEKRRLTIAACKIQHTFKNSEECAICCCCTQKSNNLKCGHNFHQHCLNKWIIFGKNTSCPICRDLLSTSLEVKLVFYLKMSRDLKKLYNTIENKDPEWFDEDDKHTFKRRYQISENYIEIISSVIYKTYKATEWAIQQTTGNRINEMMTIIAEYKTELEEELKLISDVVEII